MNLLKQFSIWSLLLLTFGCGYHSYDKNTISTAYKTIAVPYVQGDEDGLFTDALVKTIGLSNSFVYAEEGQLTLEASILSDHVEHIGYQYDRDPVSGKRIHRLIPNEGRREITLCFSVIERATQKVLYGPIKVTAASDFDFVDEDSLQDTSFIDQRGNRQSALFFSLGQLDSLEGAKTVAKTVAYRNLAQKIVLGLENLSP